MKPIGEWTDAEILAIPPSHHYAPRLGEALAAEVLRLRALWRAAEDELIVRSQAAEAELADQIDRTTQAQVRESLYRDELARCLLVVDAALRYREDYAAEHPDDYAIYSPKGNLWCAVDAYLAGESQ